MNGEPWRNDLGSGGKELLAISSGDLQAVYPCRFCQIFLTWNAGLLHQQDCIELGIIGDFSAGPPVATGNGNYA